ncbi:unnamed protein product [Cuscuta europaea]|uniref:VQ domain-containing protein n=1 Tax=Cuscuta europaea TaxID=41803 RepID=A0A9P0ZD19_CUSEU|nr:unnamed protein product [Cuscuta europaea]
MSKRSKSNGCRAVKVVIIKTEYVKTDISSFKSVVQRLTGKQVEEEESRAAETAVPAPASRFDGGQVNSACPTRLQLQRQPPETDVCFDDYFLLFGKELSSLDEFFRLPA